MVLDVHSGQRRRIESNGRSLRQVTASLGIVFQDLPVPPAGDSSAFNVPVPGTDVCYSTFPLQRKDRGLAMTTFFRSHENPTRPPEENGALLRTSLEVTPLAGCVVTHNGLVTQFNRRFAVLWGIDEQVESHREGIPLSSMNQVIRKAQRNPGSHRDFLGPVQTDFELRRCELRNGKFVEATIRTVRTNSLADDARTLFFMKVDNQETPLHVAESADRYHLLSSRQQSVAKQLASGRKSRHIAEELGITSGTVDRHRRAIFQRLRVDSVAELTRVIEWLSR